MGLYLCVFDNNDEEIDGVDVGSYADFNFFRDTVAANIEGGVYGSICPILQNHSDCDGFWTNHEARLLLTELDLIERTFLTCPPVDFDVPWKVEVARIFGIKPQNLLECFFDIDGESLTNRIRGLALSCIEENTIILFQ